MFENFAIDRILVKIGVLFKFPTRGFRCARAISEFRFLLLGISSNECQIKTNKGILIMYILRCS